MKKIVFIFSIFLMSVIVNAQNNNPFANNIFTIDSYIGDKHDNSEDLTFTKKTVEGSICLQYGFEKAIYTRSKNKKDIWQFSCTMQSKEHGKMVWKGVKDGEQISGAYLWTKQGQDPINYTFKGDLKQ